MKKDGLQNKRVAGWKATPTGMLLWAFVLVVSVMVVGFSGAKAVALAKVKSHPPVGQNASCLSCHAAATPEVAQDWEKGKHGLNNVKCFTCHSVPGEKDFTAIPAPERCAACHDAKISTFQKAARAKNGPKGCSSCHSDHSLKFHK